MKIKLSLQSQQIGRPNPEEQIVTNMTSIYTAREMAKV